tara:strand:+ start:66 stop:305 length:240 start_codon:yes stop_codon:yes gene_type:complete
MTVMFSVYIVLINSLATWWEINHGSEKELIDCPESGLSDVWASNNSAYCYRCQHEVRAVTTAKAADKWDDQALLTECGT